MSESLPLEAPPSPPPPLPRLSRLERAVGTLRFLATFSLFVMEATLLGTLSRIIPGPRMHFMMRISCRNLLRIAGIRLRVRGAAHMPAGGGFLLVCNHANMFDPFIVYALVPRHCIAIEKLSHFKWPFYGRMITSWGNLPVSSGNSEVSRRSLRLAADRLRSGTPVFIFPEGTRSRTGRLGRFRKGGFHLALDARVPVIPVVFKNADKIFLEGTMVVRPGVEDVVFLPPVSLEPFGDHDQDALSDHIHALIQAELDRPT